jgi:hypothetical protein
VWRGLDNHETEGVLRSNLRPVRLAMVQERRCRQGAHTRGEERKGPHPASSSSAWSHLLGLFCTGYVMRRVHGSLPLSEVTPALMPEELRRRQLADPDRMGLGRCAGSAGSAGAGRHALGRSNDA